ncbi:helix-turn-helix domain-containing protein [Streptomyces venezuelae]|uniref:Transcriptional regulator n=2 Tax=Streptomyces venezuelae TaxID=54571 RepID=A0A5P2BBE4_STRVZ|nr:helix-turn-helix transcriptional regulator [Streptomyces venezuelae]QES27240.1 transcriptional regulator [Streptomyces venezuelae]
MGFGALLLQWRKAAPGRPTQARTAKAMGISVRTYRKIEKGAVPPRLTPAQFESLAELFGLDDEGRHALTLHNIGSTLIAPRGSSQPQLQKALRLLIDRQMPSPAYLCDQHWNILGFNSAMAEWWPWVMEPGANLILWALTSPEARVQYQDWDMHASAYVKMLKFAEATRGDDPELRELIEKVKKDPDVLHVWDTEKSMGETRDGHVFRMNVAALDWETIEVVSHVLYPASMPQCRFVVITWVEGGEGERDALGGTRNAWAATAANQDDVEAAQWHEQNRVAEDAATRWRREAAALASRTVVSTPDEAAELAGANGVPMPAISKLMGPDAQLTLAPEQSTVVWAVEEAAGIWSVTHVRPATVIARVPREAIHGACLAEVLQLVRVALPADAAAATARIGQLLEERDTEQRVLREVLNKIKNDGGAAARETGQF